MQVLFCACAISLAAAGAALAGERCQAPVVNWQPRNVLQMRLEDQGWKVSGIRAAEGCYEAHAINAKGQRLEAYFNPQSLEAVDMKVER